MPTLDLWSLILLRLGTLTGERVSFHGLGRGQNALATTVVAYGGAAVALWAACLIFGQFHWVGAAFWPGAIYAVSFALYTASLGEGPVGLVSGFANAAVVMLFMVQPRWDLLSLTGLGLFVLGSVLLLPRGGRLTRSVVWMLLSGVALVGGRLLDASHLPVLSLPYAASLFTAVLMWLVVPITAYGAWGDVGRLVVERRSWAAAASVFNAVSYLTVLELLRYISPTLVEAVSACAGVAAVAAGVIAFREGDAAKKVAAAVLMTIATLILIFSRAGALG